MCKKLCFLNTIFFIESMYHSKELLIVFLKKWPIVTKSVVEQHRNVDDIVGVLHRAEAKLPTTARQTQWEIGNFSQTFPLPHRKCDRSFYSNSSHGDLVGPLQFSTDRSRAGTNAEKLICHTWPHVTAQLLYLVCSTFTRCFFDSCGFSGQLHCGRVRKCSNFLYPNCTTSAKYTSCEWALSKFITLVWKELGQLIF